MVGRIIAAAAAAGDNNDDELRQLISNSNNSQNSKYMIKGKMIGGNGNKYQNENSENHVQKNLSNNMQNIRN